VIQFHPHAQERFSERGTNQEEVTFTVEHGESFPAKFGRVGFRHNSHLTRYGMERFTRPNSSKFTP
jgi:hypothetical protein